MFASILESGEDLSDDQSSCFSFERVCSCTAGKYVVRKAAFHNYNNSNERYVLVVGGWQCAIAIALCCQRYPYCADDTKCIQCTCWLEFHKKTVKRRYPQAMQFHLNCRLTVAVSAVVLRCFFFHFIDRILYVEPILCVAFRSFHYVSL